MGRKWVRCTTRLGAVHGNHLARQLRHDEGRPLEASENFTMVRTGPPTVQVGLSGKVFHGRFGLSWVETGIYRTKTVACPAACCCLRPNPLNYDRVCRRST